MRMEYKLTEKEIEEYLERFTGALTVVDGDRHYLETSEMLEWFESLLEKKVEEARKEVRKNAGLMLEKYPHLHLKTWLDNTNDKGENVPWKSI